MRRTSKATPPAKAPKNGAVHTRHILEELTPSLRDVALRMAGGDWRRVKILRRGAFEILPKEAVR